ncbi:MAG: hypothetical protein JRE88_07145 [Deltaproteobacteria bacterium]|jgi:hypothetical protein|nr:hypothetical protein [Deltaproteobacteria bacterium]MBW2488180.1 hypothetical protein [Deltaproteobacteria bacterium]MBW2516540.1 hypothetical protein [Deltaproteobacteria bacterium]
MKTDGKYISAKRARGSEAVLRVLESLLADSGQKRLTGNQATVILDALASSNDPALVVRFPVVLSICARNGVSLNSHALFSKYWESSPKKQNLEKLLLLSDELFDLEGIDAPQNLKKIASPLKTKYGTLISSRLLSLSSGLTISIRTVQNILRDYTAKIKNAIPAPKSASTGYPRKPDKLERSADLDASLDRLFSPKQKDLVFKKLNGEAFTKTEREYYSRVVRKKLLSIANEQVSRIAIKLTQK